MQEPLGSIGVVTGIAEVLHVHDDHPVQAGQEDAGLASGPVDGPGIQGPQVARHDGHAAVGCLDKLDAEVTGVQGKGLAGPK